MKNLMTGAILVCATLLTAQENKSLKETNVTKENHPMTMRVKKVEIINGVEKTTDTTYTVDGPLSLDLIDKFGDEGGGKEKDMKGQKIVVITDEVHGDSIQIVDPKVVMDQQVAAALELVAADGKHVENVMTLNVNTDVTESDGKKTTRIVILKTTKLVEPNAEDAKMLGQQTGVTDGELVLDNMSFYPNPGNGKFNLSFSLPGKGDAEITILNSEGKKVYTEKLTNFSGTYNKEIDISQNPKGAYFVRIGQGAHAQVKKVVLE